MTDKYEEIVRLYQPAKMTIEGTVRLFQNGEDETRCVCCGGQPHVFGIRLDLDARWPSTAIPLINKDVSAVLDTWLYTNRFVFRGRRVRVTFELLDDGNQAALDPE